MRAAVIGAGPSGFYATDQLLGAGFQVDLYDSLPTPFGLVRSGVAPDHPKIKTVTRAFEKTASDPRFQFVGGVEIGSDVTREELLSSVWSIDFDPELPRHPNGKLYKRILRDRYWRNRDSKII